MVSASTGSSLDLVFQCWWCGKGDDDVLIDGRWRMIQNCRVYRSAQFLNTDDRFVVATLKLQLKSRRMVPSQPRLDAGKLKDERVAEEFANKLSGDLGGLGAFGDPKELWSAFKTTVLDVSRRCLGYSQYGEEKFWLSSDTAYHGPVAGPR